MFPLSLRSASFSWHLVPPILLAFAPITSLGQNTSCDFTLQKTKEAYDLCPLWHTGSFELSSDEETPPTRTRYEYSFDLDSPLKRDRTLPADLQCPEDTHICLRVINTRPNHPLEPERILQVVPIASKADLRPTAKLGKKNTTWLDFHAPLVVSLHGGSYNGERQKASFYFRCDHDAPAITKPKYLWDFNGTHAFSWSSRHACPITIPDAPSPTIPDEEDDPALPEDPEFDFPTPSEGGASSSSALVTPFVFMTVMMLLVLGFMMHSQRSRVRGLLLKTRFPWAAGLKSPYKEDEEYGYLIADLGEEMPLTPSTGGFPEGKWPGESRYGTVRDS